MPGDTIRMEVYAKYVDGSASNTQALIDFLASILTGTAPAGTVIDGAGYTSSTSSFGYANMLNHGANGDTAPMAYLNYITFDRDFNPLIGDLSQSNFVKITTAARETGTDGTHERLTATVVAKQAGYMYIYLSNDNPTPVDVFFDDFKVTQVMSPVVQVDEYYPFGAVSSSYQRENSVENKRLYQSKELIKDLGLELYDFGPREYDAWRGQTTTHDPHAENYYDWSPYSWAFGNPVRFGDPSGKDPIDKAIGFLSAALDNALGGVTNLRSIAANYVDDAEDFNTGQDGGDVFSMMSGVMEAETGAGLTA